MLPKQRIILTQLDNTKIQIENRGLAILHCLLVSGKGILFENARPLATGLNKDVFLLLEVQISILLFIGSEKIT